MRVVELESWPRRVQYEVYCGFDNPHFNLCANVDLSVFYPAVKDWGVSINIAIIYVLARTANAIPEFRYRIRGETVVAHDVVHPSTTVLTNDDLFTFCTIRYDPDIRVFTERAAERIAYVRENPTLEDEPGQDDLLYLTAIPWVSFTTMMHPFKLPMDSVPRIAWGKFFQEGDALKMPLSVQGHHGLMDGLHAGRFYERVQADLDGPDDIFGAVEQSS